ncbi:MAG: ribosome biogenesis GTP-binding protein YihA/YsxC [Myxococcota bacterium]|nr:ribosome biogenesis GTP-binding protein YihA/YsxC [Myxococcota bacterium]MDW8361526.1 ribosome biogenesis GTP-binding protein YihA/YsxC [Myxococcales bacterium]
MHVRDARLLRAVYRLEHLPPPQFPEIAFAGRSNVGKSSLINAWVGRRNLAHTSATPGRTRGLFFYRVEFVHPPATLDLVDLPGYGHAARSHAERAGWKTLVEGFLERRPSLSAVAVLVDVRRGLRDEDRQLLEYLRTLGRPALVVATKTDTLRAAERHPTLERMRRELRDEHPFVPTSAERREGLDALSRTLLTLAGFTTQPPTDSRG